MGNGNRRGLGCDAQSHHNDRNHPDERGDSAERDTQSVQCNLVRHAALPGYGAVVIRMSFHLH